MEIRLGTSLVIDSQDIRFETARSSGPGGQNVNKVSTKVTLCFDLQGTRALDAAKKRILRRKLASRISKMGILRLADQGVGTAASLEVAVELWNSAITDLGVPREHDLVEFAKTLQALRNLARSGTGRALILGREARPRTCSCRVAP